jgi:hypothetical protein
MITTYERGMLEGLTKGPLEGQLEERRETTLLQLAAKFGPLAAAVQERVAALSSEQLRQLLLDLVKTPSLKDLRLED